MLRGHSSISGLSRSALWFCVAAAPLLGICLLWPPVVEACKICKRAGSGWTCKTVTSGARYCMYSNQNCTNIGICPTVNPDLSSAQRLSFTATFFFEPPSRLSSITEPKLFGSEADPLVARSAAAELIGVDDHELELVEFLVGVFPHSETQTEPVPIVMNGNGTGLVAFRSVFSGDPWLSLGTAEFDDPNRTVRTVLPRHRFEPGDMNAAMVTLDLGRQFVAVIVNVELDLDAFKMKEDELQRAIRTRASSILRKGRLDLRFVDDVESVGFFNLAALDVCADGLLPDSAAAAYLRKGPDELFRAPVDSLPGQSPRP